MPVKVADASVLAAIIFQEPGAEEALSLIAGSELYEPALLAYELTSVARKKALQHPELREVLLQALEVGLAMDIRWLDVAHGAVLRLALETGLTTYDASYLYLARSLSIPLVSFDQRLAAVIRQAKG